MNAGIIAGQMLVLFFMMLAGFIAFKAHIVSQAGSKSLSSVIINIFNPCLIISGVLNKKITYSPRMVAENLVLVAVFFLVLIVLSRLFTKMMRLLPGEVEISVPSGARIKLCQDGTIWLNGAHITKGGQFVPGSGSGG